MLESNEIMNLSSARVRTLKNELFCCPLLINNREIYGWQYSLWKSVEYKFYKKAQVPSMFLVMRQQLLQRSKHTIFSLFKK